MLWIVRLWRTFWNHTATLWVFRTLYYLLILLGLLWIYGLNDEAPPSHFIYTNF